VSVLVVCAKAPSGLKDRYTHFGGASLLRASSARAEDGGSAFLQIVDICVVQISSLA
jgi:hypothetical protein